MPFDQKSFRSHSIGAALPAASSRSARDWRYLTNDDHATVSAAGYFNAHRAHLGVGDTVLASLDLDATPALRLYMFNAVPATGNVTVVELSVTTG